MRRTPPVLGLDVLRRGNFGASPYGSHSTPAAAGGAVSILLEAGDELLLESGDKWLLESGASAAKITALTENTSPVGTDLLLLVDDPAGTPLSQKMTFATFRTYVLT